MKKFLMFSFILCLSLAAAAVSDAATPTNSPTSTITPTVTKTTTPTPSVTTTPTPTPSFTPCPDFTYIPTPADPRDVARIIYTTRLVGQLQRVLSPVRTPTWIPTPRTQNIQSNINFNRAALLQIEPLMVLVTPTFYPTPASILTPGACTYGTTSRTCLAEWFKLVSEQFFTACP